MNINKREFMKFSLLKFFLIFFLKSNLRANYIENTKVLTNLIFFEHIISPNHPEKPERIKYILDYNKSSVVQGNNDKKSSCCCCMGVVVQNFLLLY